jgi:hypothetical protein
MTSINTTLGTNKARSEPKTSSRISSRVSGTGLQVAVQINNTQKIRIPMKISIGLVLPMPIKSTIEELLTLSTMIIPSKMRVTAKVSSIAAHNTIQRVLTPPPMEGRIKRQLRRKPERMNFIGLTIRRTTRRNKSSNKHSPIRTRTSTDSKPGDCVRSPSRNLTLNMSLKRAASFTT